MLIELTLLLLVAFVAGSIGYVYAFRGEVRYASLGQYLRKGWPLFAPLNCLLYATTAPRGRGAVVARRRFPELDVIRDNWETIREEALALHADGTFDRTADPNASAYYDLGFRTFYKYGWRKFYLKWYGTRHASARAHCPRTLAILDRVPSVKGAMFSVLPAGGQLTPHSDPAACSLRYHLGLATPNTDAAFINVDGQELSWRDGADFVFDETYQHFARNDTDQDRLILMCDVERPTWLIGPVINAAYQAVMRLTVVPNTDADRRGLVNRVFARLAPLLARTRELKRTRRPLYLTLKHTVNASLVVLAFGVVLGLVTGLDALLALEG